MVFGGIHSTLFPDEAREHGQAHAVVRGDGDLIWSRVIADCAAGAPQLLYEGGRVDGDRFVAARWDLLPAGRYMWGSVQTVRGCPKHCSFCSVWKTDGQKPRQRGVEEVVREIVELRRQGFRFILLADDNFYPVSVADLQMARRRADKSRLDELTALRDERFELMERLSHLPDDLVFYTQITMEAAEDPEFLDAMNRARIRGALVGVESVTPEGLKAVYKDFNLSGDALVARLQVFRKHGVHVLGSFIFGLPTDKPETFVADRGARAAGRRDGRAVRHAHAVSRHGGLRQVGERGHRRRRGRRRAAHAVLADSAVTPAEGVLAAPAHDARTRSAATRRRRGTGSTSCRASGNGRRASSRCAAAWLSS